MYKNTTRAALCVKLSSRLITRTMDSWHRKYFNSSEPLSFLSQLHTLVTFTAPELRTGHIHDIVRKVKWNIKHKWGFAYYTTRKYSHERALLSSAFASQQVITGRTAPEPWIIPAQKWPKAMHSLHLPSPALTYALTFKGNLLLNCQMTK